MGLIQNIFSKKGERYPKSNWVTCIIERDDIKTPLVGIIDTAYRNYPFPNEAPWLANITVQLEEINDVGGPTDEEAKLLNTFEDFLIHTKRFRSLACIHWVARLTYNGVRDIMFYTDNPEPIHAYLQDIIDREDHPRSFKYEIVKDSKWESVSHIFSDIDEKGSFIRCEGDKINFVGETGSGAVLH